MYFKLRIKSWQIEFGKRPILTPAGNQVLPEGHQIVGVDAEGKFVVAPNPSIGLPTGVAIKYDENGKVVAHGAGWSGCTPDKRCEAHQGLPTEEQK